MADKIEYMKWTFLADKIKSGNLYLASSLSFSALEADSFSAVVECGDPAILDFERNTQLLYYTKPEQPMIFRVQNITRIGSNFYEISATSTLGLLIEGKHYGGIYTGQTAQEVIEDICGSVSVLVKTSLQPIPLYGWLPIASPRDNLSQVLFAIGASLKTDLDGVLRVAPLWDGISGDIPKNRIYIDSKVRYGAKVSQVIVFEHQYVPGTEEKRIFDGTTRQGDIITFNEPVHDLKANGFTILDSGANWAKVSTGSGTLTGKTYIHNTRQTIRDVSPAQEPNIKTVRDATLISLVNSISCAKRIASYYAFQEVIDAHVIYHGEQPGDRVTSCDPFGRVPVTGCLESADITLSNQLAAMTKLRVGFVPNPDPGQLLTDERVVLTGQGYVQIPDGVEDIVYVLIGGAQGGRAGKKGGDGTQRSFSYSGTSSVGTQYSYRGYCPGPGGKGGLGGEPGAGGKVFVGALNVSGLKQLAYQCGPGGAGAAYDPANPDAEGSLGAPTILAGISSDRGASSDSGYTDVVTGEVYAARGEPGISGGDGAGNDLPSISSEEDVLTITQATQVIDENGKAWNGGSTKTNESGGIFYRNVSVTVGYPYPGGSRTSQAVSSVNLGGGAAAGAAGTAGGEETGSISSIGNTELTSAVSTAYSLPGINGQSAKLVPKKASNGMGGTGGYGGGGGSSAGIGLTGGSILRSGSPSPSVTEKYYPADSGIGGAGAKGGDGADGLIILYWSKPKKISYGQLVDKNGKWILDRLGRRIIM